MRFDEWPSVQQLYQLFWLWLSPYKPKKFQYNPDFCDRRPQSERFQVMGRLWHTGPFNLWIKVVLLVAKRRSAERQRSVLPLSIIATLRSV